MSTFRPSKVVVLFFLLVCNFFVLVLGDWKCGETWEDFEERKSLIWSDSEDMDSFGGSVSINGDIMAVGSWGAGVEGACYTYVRNGITWTEQQKLTASDAFFGDMFGVSVSVGQNSLIVGAQGETSGTGAAYILSWNGSYWVEQQKLTASDGAVDDYFGWSVAIFENTAVVGAYLDDSQRGSVYVFTRNASNVWEEKQKLVYHTVVAGDQYGYSVSLEGSTLVVGGGFEDSGTGAAYVFHFNGSTWIEKQKLTASDGTTSDYFGSGVSLSGDTIIVGADGADDYGAAYVYRKFGPTWIEEEKLTPSGSSSAFGYSVSVSGDLAIIGAYGESLYYKQFSYSKLFLKDQYTGSAFIFSRNGTIWREKQKIEATDGDRNHYYGYSVSLNGETSVVGSYGFGPSGNKTGKVYVYDNSCNSRCVMSSLLWSDLSQCCKKNLNNTFCHPYCGVSPQIPYGYCKNWTCFSILMNDTNNVCSGNGTCIAPDTCVCHSNETKTYNCAAFYCNGFVPEKTENVCSGNGTCVEEDDCLCPEYAGKYCENWNCDVFLNNDTDNVCSGNGTCNSPDTCICGEYVGKYCGNWECGGVLRNDSNVCSSNGTCVSPDVCLCGLYAGNLCENWYCNGDMNNDTSRVCSGNGTCNSPDECLCGQYAGTFCDNWECGGIFANDSFVCSSNGTCNSPEVCICPEYNGENCQNWKCGEFLNNETEDVCSGNGTCNSPGNCLCGPYVGKFCDNWECSGLYANDSNVCSSNGTCNSPEICVCLPGFVGRNCENWKCDGELNNDTQIVCSGNGTCVSPDKCSCGQYVGNFCGNWECGGILANKSNVCSSNGSCNSPEVCICPQYVGRYCENWKCNGLLNNDTLNVCSGHGTCDAPDYPCNCEKYYSGRDCNETTCFSVPSMSKDACSESGVCWPHDNCSCYSNFGGVACNLTYCNNTRSDDLSVCSSQGVCWPYEICSCYANYSGKYCEQYKCFEVFANESGSVCSGYGICSDVDTCVCENGRYGNDCSDWTCNGISKMDDDEVCLGHGECVDIDDCKCDQNYFGNRTNCDEWFCGGINRKHARVCSGHGQCVAYEFCVCHEEYPGATCELWGCFNHSFSDPSACSGHGVCIGISGYSNFSCQDMFCNGVHFLNESVCSGKGSCYLPEVCVCDEFYAGQNCEIHKCGPYELDHPFVCNGRGLCVSPDVCVCDLKGHNVDTSNLCDCLPGWFSKSQGSSCNITQCNGVDSDDPNVCRGEGKCIVSIDNERQQQGEYSVCVCNPGREGDDCEVSTAQKRALNNLISIVVVVVVIILCCIVVVPLVIAILVYGLRRQKLRLKKFDNLKDVDILLAEQELENIDGPKLRINSKLFEARWGGRIVAFKKWNTKDIGSTQSSFDEFEKEVSIMASINHPAILEFYGASILPNAVGIVMRYAENGDLQHFLQKFSKSGSSYPFPKKLSLLEQTAQGMEHLHSQSVIHRDLKLLNVLVTANEQAKIMDFGMSKLRVDEKTMTMMVGTCCFMSPEITLGKPYDSKVDVFSFGIMTYCVVTDIFEPYGVQNLNVELKVANDSSFRPVVENMNAPVFLSELMAVCWDENPQKRPDFKEIRQIFSKELKEITKSITLYIKTESQSDEDASDVELHERCYLLLENVITNEFSAVPSEVRVERTNEIIMSDEGVEKLKEDDILVVKFGRNYKREFEELEKEVRNLKKLKNENEELQKAIASLEKQLQTKKEFN